MGNSASVGLIERRQLRKSVLREMKPTARKNSLHFQETLSSQNIH